MAELRAAEATPSEIEIVIEYCQRNFTAFTETALCNWLSRALQEQTQKSNIRELFRKANGL